MYKPICDIYQVFQVPVSCICLKILLILCESVPIFSLMTDKCSFYFIFVKKCEVKRIYASKYTFTLKNANALQVCIQILNSFVKFTFASEMCLHMTTYKKHIKSMYAACIVQTNV